MRPAVVAAAVLAALPAVGSAQPGPYLATVVDPEVRLLAGPSDKFPDTGTLLRGARVVVDHEESNGWLAVEAPAGQVSWIPTQFIEGFDPGRPTPQLVNVASEGDVTLAAGKVGLPEPLNIRKVRVPNGTVLTVAGPKATFADRTWYPVVPPAGDFRYLPKTAVQFEKPANTGFLVRESAPVPTAGGSATPASGVTAGARPDGTVGSVHPAAAPAPAKPAVDHPLWAQAEAAEKNGQAEEAEKLYFQLARLMNEPGGNRDVANLCYTRIHTLREKKRPGTSPVSAGVPAGPGNPAWQAANPAERPTLLPPTREGGSLPPSPTAGSKTTPSTEPKDEGQKWTGPGMLVRSGATPNGKRAYALESSPGVVKVYVVPTPGLDLDKYVNRRVDVFGTPTTHRDLSKPLVVAVNVEPGQ